MAALEKTKMVAIVDDDDLMRSALQGLLKAVDMPAQAFASAEEFLRSGQQRQAGCLIADIRMPGMSGLELQAKLNAENCRIPIIFITAHRDEKMRMQALRAGALELGEPADLQLLLQRGAGLLQELLCRNARPDLQAEQGEPVGWLVLERGARDLARCLLEQIRLRDEVGLAVDLDEHPG